MTPDRSLSNELIAEREQNRSNRIDFLLTKSIGLSLGDRACLALAESLGVPALTSDRAWATLNLGIQVELIR